VTKTAITTIIFKNFNLYRLLSLQVETFDPNNLPSDLQGIPAIKPGSK